MNRSRIIYNMFYDIRRRPHEAYVAQGKNAAAVISPGTPLWIYMRKDMPEKEICLFFYSCLQNISVPFKGLVAPEGTAEICAAIRGGEYSKREITVYYLSGGLTPEASDKNLAGELTEAVPADASVLGKWLKAFYAETFKTEFKSAGTPCLRQAAEGLHGDKLFVWRDSRPPGGLITAMGMLCGGEETARLNLIYTPPRLRRRGYGSAMVRALSQIALDAGKIPVLYTAAGNAASNALYRSLGFTEAGGLTEIIFKG